MEKVMMPLLVLALIVSIAFLIKEMCLGNSATQRSHISLKDLEQMDLDSPDYLQRADKFLRGRSAYEIACDLGFVGTKEEWVMSMRPKPDSFESTSYELATPMPILRHRVEKQMRTHRLRPARQVTI